MSSDFNPYKPGVDAHLPDRAAPLAPGQTDPRAKRSAVLGGIAACCYMLPPAAIVLGIIAMMQARSFMESWYANPQIRGRGAAIAGKALGIGSVVVGIFMGLYYLWIFLQISDSAPPRPY